MAEATREQVAVQLQQIEHEKLQRQIAIQPRFVLTSFGSSRGSGAIEYRVAIKNGGAIATNIHVSVEPEPPVGAQHSFATIGPQDEYDFRLKYSLPPPESGIIVMVKFTDAGGNDGRQQFAGIINGNGLRFVKVPA